MWTTLANRLTHPPAHTFASALIKQKREELTQRLFCDRQEEHDVPSREKPHNRWQLDAAVPGSPKHDVARWATPQEEYHVLVSPDLDVVLL